MRTRRRRGQLLAVIVVIVIKFVFVNFNREIVKDNNKLNRIRIQSSYGSHSRLPYVLLLILPSPSREFKAKSTFMRVAGIDPRFLLFTPESYHSFITNLIVVLLTVVIIIIGITFIVTYIILLLHKYDSRILAEEALVHQCPFTQRYVKMLLSDDLQSNSTSIYLAPLYALCC